MSGTPETTSRRSAEAGHWGKEVRSNVHVAFEARDSGGVEISLESRVAPYYGAAIMEQTRDVLAELGVKHARVAIHDEGALPFIISSRLEAAARRAGSSPGKRSLSQQHPLPPPSPKDRLRRSRLYLPGSEPKYYINASLHGPDANIDLSGCWTDGNRAKIFLRVDAPGLAVEGLALDGLQGSMFLRPQFSDVLTFSARRGGGVAEGSFVRRYADC